MMKVHSFFLLTTLSNIKNIYDGNFKWCHHDLNDPAHVYQSVLLHTLSTLWYIWQGLDVTAIFFSLQAMRSHEGNEAQVCYFIIQLLLLKPNDFRNRVNDFVKDNSPEHWMQSDWHNKHMSYHKVLTHRWCLITEAEKCSYHRRFQLI